MDSIHFSHLGMELIAQNFANKIKEKYDNKDLSIFSNEKVLQFYKELPFNYYSSVEEQSKNILLGNKI